jgi:hypothetical protein
MSEIVFNKTNILTLVKIRPLSIWVEIHETF